MKQYTITPVRRIALQILRKPVFLHDALNEHAEYHTLSTKDKALLLELVYGVTRHRLTLETLIHSYSKHHKTLDPLISKILQLGIYQLLFLDRIPAHAAINQSVALVKKSPKKWLAGYVNAVLRHIQRDIQRCEAGAEASRYLPINDHFGYRFAIPVFPSPGKHPAEYLSLAYSYPLWLVRDWLEQFGEEQTRQLLLRGNEAPPLVVRIRPAARKDDVFLQRLYQATDRVLHSEEAIFLQNAGSVTELPGFREGWITIQGAASMAVAPFMAPEPDETVLDLCAAPGGKATHLAELMGERGCVVAADISRERLQRLQQNCRRLTIRCIQPVVLDGCRPLPLRRTFDRILIDAPCSNTAVLARRVEARWRATPESIKALADIQGALLLNASEHLKVGGTLVYATCSLQREENQEVIERFLNQKPDFVLNNKRQILPLSPGLDGVTMFQLVRR